MRALFHVSSVLNRESIWQHGLDVSLMGVARGIAGSLGPEVSGCFLCTEEFEVEFFTEINNTGGPVDVWEVSGIDRFDLMESPNGYFFYPGTIAASQVRLIES
jgi:hypothetical protein